MGWSGAHGLVRCLQKSNDQNFAEVSDGMGGAKPAQIHPSQTLTYPSYAPDMLLTHP